MKRLFIIGNGFDIAHNLPTKYADFKKFLEKTDIKLFNKIFEIYKYSLKRKVHPITHDILNFDGDECDWLWNDFEKAMNYVNESVIPNKYDFNLEYEDEYDEQIKIIINNDIREFFYGVYEQLQDKLMEWVTSIDITNTKKKTLLINKKNRDLYLTFNYTKVLEEIYSIEEKICHIHGELENLPLIIGHNNNTEIIKLKKELNYFKEDIGEIEEYEETYNEYTERRKYEELLNYYEETYKNTYHHIEKNYDFFKNILEVDEILVIGHALNEVDMPYFKYIFSNLKNEVKWKIYCYSVEDKEIFRNKILNLGEKEENIEIIDAKEFWE